MAVVALADYLPRMALTEPIAAGEAVPAVDPLVEALATARREADADAEARLAALRAEHAVELEARLVEARRTWVADEADRLSDRIGKAFRELETSIADATARVLVPFVATAARRLAVDDLVARLRRLSADAGSGPIRVTGPADLLAALEARLGDVSAMIEFADGDTADVIASAGRTIVATQIGAWADQIWKQEAEAHG